jgi:hypothetical protein
MNYRYLLLASLLCTGLAAADESIEVTVTGKLATGIAAIGGETTGTTITANKVTWELDFGKNEALRAAAEKLDGQQVTVTGVLDKRAGVEVRERWIVTVASLKRAGEKKSRAKLGLEAKGFREGTQVTIAGDLKQTSVEIRCERGIDGCVLQRTGEQWPEKLELKLQLRGLESLKVTSGNAMLEWSVPSSGESATNVTLHSGKRVAVLAAGNPLFASVNKVKEQEANYFLLQIPANLLAENPDQLKLQWIDFYR